MGLSTTYANIFMFVAFLTSLALLMSVYSGYVGKTALEVKAQSHAFDERLGTNIDIAQIATSTSDDGVTFYIVNDGRSNLDINCTDFFIDRTYVKRTDMSELVILNNTFDPGLWNPGETVKMRTTYVTEHNVEHEGAVVSCNGIKDSTIFWWAS
jgi:archaellum component FlaF (FlaF/FlaG flagellin family)